MIHRWRHDWAANALAGLFLGLLIMSRLSWWAARKLIRWL